MTPKPYEEEVNPLQEAIRLLDVATFYVNPENWNKMGSLRITAALEREEMRNFIERHRRN